jgi:microcystin-dependent protein
MSTPFLSEIRLVSFNFPPKGWAECNGQILSIQQNTALFSLIGTTYGGNGVSTFALPNLQGNVPLMFGDGYSLGEVGGENNVSLTTMSIPAHTHTLQGTNTAATTNVPTGASLSTAGTTLGNVYGPGTSLTTLAPQAIGNTGGGVPHPNQQPYLVLNYVIALTGIFPSRG